MRTLTKRIDGFDKINSFGIEYKNWRGQKGVTTKVGEVTNDSWAN